MSASPSLIRNSNLVLLWIGQLASQAERGCSNRPRMVDGFHLRENGGLSMGCLLVVGSLPGLIFVNRIGRIVDLFPTRL